MKKYSNISEARNLYLAAKDAYYNNIETIIDDKEFDELEEWLKENDKEFKSFVGAPSKENKFEHWSPMLSLEKIQIKPDSGNDSDLLTLTDEILNWKNNTNVFDHEKHFDITPKFDGVSINLQYENGKLLRAITRGDKVKGRDVTNRIKTLVPNEIESTIDGHFYERIEIRGEILMPIEIFKQKYSKDFKNPRNIVSGILSNKEVDFDFSDLMIVPFEVRPYFEGLLQHLDYTTIGFYLSKNWKFSSLGNKYFVDYFNYSWATKLEDFEDVASIFIKLSDFRNKCPFQLDGFVIKYFDGSVRNKLGEKDTHPKWAKAIKFLPKVTTTFIEDINWHLGKTGEFTPVAKLKPIDLDGTTITHASLHNYATIKRLGTSIGAEVSIEKKGDIIPQITEIIKSSEADFNYPIICPYCEHPTLVDEIRVVCSNTDCFEVKTLKFVSGLSRLEYDYLGEKNARKVYETGLFSDIFEVFDRSKMTIDNLIQNGFSDGKIVRKIVEGFSRKRELSIAMIIRLMDIDRIGSKTAFMLSEYFSGNEPDFSGLEKSLIESFTNGELKEKYLQIVERLEEYGIEIILNSKPKVNAMSRTYEMTGSPKGAGWKVKDHFVADAENAGFKHSSLTAKTDLLITDSYSSNSGKMDKARKFGIEIITYDDFKSKYIS